MRAAAPSLWSVISDPLNHHLEVNNGTLNKLKGFKDLIESFRQAATRQNTAELAETIVQQSGILRDITAERTPENISRQENIEELLNGVMEFCTLRQEAGETETTLSDFLAEISLASDQDNGDEAEQDKVTLMTVHASKGLEFKQVFIVGVEENLFPSSMCQGSEREIEEERRLLYVAITAPAPRYVDLPAQERLEEPREEKVPWRSNSFGGEWGRKPFRRDESDDNRTPAPRPFTAPAPAKRLTRIEPAPLL